MDFKFNSIVITQNDGRFFNDSMYSCETPYAWPSKRSFRRDLRTTLRYSSYFVKSQVNNDLSKIYEICVSNTEKYKDGKILEIETHVVDEVSVVKTTTVSDLHPFASKQLFLIVLKDIYGSSLTKLLDRMDEQNQTDQFKYILISKTNQMVKQEDFDEVISSLRASGLKANKDFKKTFSSHDKSGAIGVVDLDAAMMIKLSGNTSFDVFDLKTNALIKNN